MKPGKVFGSGAIQKWKDTDQLKEKVEEYKKKIEVNIND
jgi:hypothetical protein